MSLSQAVSDLKRLITRSDDGYVEENLKTRLTHNKF